MHNNIMAAGSRDRPPMLATGRYAQWRSRFLRYIDTRPNGDALRKCILEGPYTPTTVVVPAVPATENSPAVPEQTTVETVMNMTPANKAHFESEKEAIHLILTGIGDEIYSTVDACKTTQEMWEAIERLQQDSKPNTPPSESLLKEDRDPEQAQKDKDLQKILASHCKEIDELESEKAEFSNMYDMLLQECVSNDIMCSYLHSLSDLDKINELQCLYLHKVKECDCLAQKLSEQTEFVSKEIYTELLRSFAKLEKHSISLEIALQQCQEQLKNDTVCKEKASNVFQKEREQYFEIQYLKAQLQDKNIAITELKKLIEKCKGKYVETKFDKPSVVRQPNAQRIPNHHYGDLVQGNITINRVYYVEGLNHNLFLVGQLCDSDLEVAFRKSTCFVRDLQGNDLLTGNRGTDLYTIYLQETTSPTLICLMAKASPTQSWLWHRRLSHLNFDYVNLLLKKDVVIGLPKLKYVKD
ncbi:retrovirus-related pol polyprotein from transposon TNT 1-94 [Tanacetum coccineum]